MVTISYYQARGGPGTRPASRRALSRWARGSGVAEPELSCA